MAGRYLQGLAERPSTDLGRAGTGERRPIDDMDAATAEVIESCLHRADRDADATALEAVIDVPERRHGAALAAPRPDAFAERHARALRELERDRLFTERLRERTGELGLPSVSVDGAVDEAGLVETVADRLGLGSRPARARVFEVCPPFP